MSQCYKCGNKLNCEDIGIYKKLVRRTTQEFLCKNCLAEYFRCDLSLIETKIQQLRESGCFLFPKL